MKMFIPRDNIDESDDPYKIREVKSRSHETANIH